MNTALWIVQILTALAFVMAGIMKVVQPKEKLIEMMKWVEDFSQSTIRGIGTLEILGAAGLILPALTGILPWLTPLAAVGLVLVMIGAIATHLRRNETQVIVVNIVLLALAAFVVYGRFIAVPL
ncbi:MAG: DoxX family protein [Anaerolineae bacterium]|nr:DoxX family protein [Anaerolineae bacterium]